MVGIEDFSNEGPRPLQRGDYYEIAKIYLQNLNIFFSRTHRAQVHIRGYEVVHTGDVEFEARKQRKVDLISFSMIIKIKVVTGIQ